MRHLLTTVFLLLGLVLAAQGETILTRYTMAVSFADVTSLTTTTHRATLNAQSDQLGEGYLANQIQVGYRVLTSTKRHFEVTTIDNSSFGSATVVLTEIGGTTLGPNGSGVLYDPGANGMIPPLPANATGVSQALLANMLIHNFEVAQTLVGGGSSSDWADITNKPAGFDDNIDDVDDADADPNNELQNWGNLPGIPAGFSDGVDNVDDADADPTNEDNGFVLFEGRYYTTRADGTRIGSGVAPPANSFLSHYTGGATNLALFSARLFAAGGTSSSVNLTGNNTAGYLFSTTDAVETIIIEGDSGSSNASGEFVLTIDQNNADANTFKLGHFSYQLYDLTNDQKVDEHLTGNVLRQVYDSTTGETQLTLPNVGGNYPNGFRLILN